MRAAHRHERMSISPRRFNWQRPWALYSLLGLTLSLGVHALTYAGIDASRDMPLVWALHVGGMLAFLAMIIVGRPTRSPNGLQLPDWPAWAYVLSVAMLLYAAFNFVHSNSLMEGGTPEVIANRYVLSVKGGVSRTLFESEYWLQKAYFLRFFSGAWMLFFLVPTLYFGLRRDEQGADQQPRGRRLTNDTHLSRRSH
jgi:hypothetical protein